MDMGILLLKLGDDGERGVVGVACTEDEFELRVILLEKTFKVALELGFHAVDRLKKRDRRRKAERLFTAGEEAQDGVKSEDEESGGTEDTEESGVKEDVSEGVQREIVTEGIGDRDRGWRLEVGVRERSFAAPTGIGSPVAHSAELWQLRQTRHIKVRYNAGDWRMALCAHLKSSLSLFSYS